MYSYKKLEDKLHKIGLSKSDLTNKLNISSRTISKMKKGEKIANHVLSKIAIFLNCSIDELVDTVYENHILQILKEEKQIKLHGGLYHELQVRMTYNSNHIEGSKLSEQQTRLIFETRTIDCSDIILIDDIIETNNHFKAINYVIDVALEPISEEIIKHLHFILKQGTKDSEIDWFNVGEYKKKANIVAGRETCKPQYVEKEIKLLINSYLSKNIISIEDIIDFHVKFERIHPFQDGNGRVGRLIILKECLKYNIIPFIIEDSKKSFYYRGLTNYDNDKQWLIDTCLDGQDSFKSLLNMLDIPEKKQ